MAARREDVYERDFHVWARKQAAGLKQLAAMRPNIDIDWSHLIDEVDEIAVDYRDTCRSQLRRVMEHLLKLEFSPARDPRVGWVEEIGDARDILENKPSNTLRRDPRRNFGKIYARTRKRAAQSLSTYGEHEAAARLPADCPYTLDQLLDDFLPGLEGGPTR
jgi:Domain of unknown function DUF29